MVSVCLPSDALSQHLPFYLGFSYLGRGVSLQGCSSKAQPLLLTLDQWYLLMAAPSDLECGGDPLSPPAPVQPLLPRTWGCSPQPRFCAVRRSRCASVQQRKRGKQHPKGNQSWIVIVRTDVEAEAPILWPPDAKSWFIWKDPDAGKVWGKEEKGMAEYETDGWHHRLNGHEFG